MAACRLPDRTRTTSSLRQAHQFWMNFAIGSVINGKRLNRQAPMNHRDSGQVSPVMTPQRPSIWKERYKMLAAKTK